MKEYTIPQAQKAIKKHLLRIEQALKTTRENPEQRKLASLELQEACRIFKKAMSCEGEKKAQYLELGDAQLESIWNHLHASEILEYSVTGVKSWPAYRKMHPIKIHRPVKESV